MSWRIHQGDALEVLRTLPDESVHCCVTSPPYWGLRDYGTEGQLGLERTPEEYVEKLVAVFREVRRVLSTYGTLWVVLGDSYATGAGKVGSCPGGGEQGERWKGNRGTHDAKNSGLHGPSLAAMRPRTQPNRMPLPGLKSKDLIGIPWRVAFALQTDGWWLRSDIIWSKPNPMPESVTDRPTKAHEYVFLLAKSERYWYDADVIREPYNDASLNRYKYQFDASTSPGRHQPNNKDLRYLEKTHNAPNERGRNKRTVWSVPTQPFQGPHFSTYPLALIEPCILAGCPVAGTVLDPFCGAGTTALVALRNGRAFIGIELVPETIDLATRRIEEDAPLFNRQEMTVDG